MSHFKAKIHQIHFLVSVCLSIVFFSIRPFVCFFDGVWHLDHIAEWSKVLVVWLDPVLLGTRAPSSKSQHTFSVPLHLVLSVFVRTVSSVWCDREQHCFAGFVGEHAERGAADGVSRSASSLGEDTGVDGGRRPNAVVVQAVDCAVGERRWTLWQHGLDGRVRMLLLFMVTVEFCQYYLFLFHCGGCLQPRELIPLSMEPASPSLCSVSTADYVLLRLCTKFGERAFSAEPQTWNALLNIFVVRLVSTASNVNSSVLFCRAFNSVL